MFENNHKSNNRNIISLININLNRTLIRKYITILKIQLFEV